jgi:hypothetical protein
VYFKNIQEFSGQDIYFIFDETTSVQGKHMINIVFEKCHEICISKGQLMKSVEINKTNSSNVILEITNLCVELGF